MSEHTPTPWHFSRKFRYVSDINHKVIAEIAPLVGFEANAAFIVKAVNNHAKLVEALDIARKMISGEIIEAAVIDTQTMEGLGSMIDRVLADLIPPRH